MLAVYLDVVVHKDEMKDKRVNILPQVIPLKLFADIVAPVLLRVSCRGCSVDVFVEDLSRLCCQPE